MDPLTTITIASILIGAVVEMVYRPARMRHVDALWIEIYTLQERISILEARLEERRCQQ